MDSDKQIPEKDPQPVELHHREVTDMFGDAPDWLIHSGSYLLYGILVLFLIGSALINYPDVVRGTAVVDDLANVEWITANSSGSIDRFFVGNDSLVKRGDTIAILQNPARIKDIHTFLMLLTKVEQYYRTNNTDLIRTFHYDLVMGEMSDAYQNFTKAVRNCRIYDDHNYTSQRKSFLQKELDILEKEPEKNQLALLKVQQDIFELSISDKMEMEKNKEQLELAYEIMVNSLRAWDSKYLIRSHSNGRIILGELRAMNHLVNKGDTIGSILSSNKEDFVARMQLRQEQIAGVVAGDEVNIRLAQYPEYSYGILTGRVYSISFVPGNQTYVVDIKFPNQLITTAGKEVKYELGLKGEAEIITSNRSVLSRIFHPIFNLLRDNKG